jgi:hypothetical protein
MSLEQLLELYKDDLSEESENCLISREKLDNSMIQLKCGHKFNYESLLKDIYNHKLMFNSFERGMCRLNSFQIRCPYCRTIQNELLPYRENSCRHHGVNFRFGNINYKAKECFFSKLQDQLLDFPSSCGLNIDKTIKCNSINCLFILNSELNNIAKNKFKINFIPFKFCKNHISELKDLLLGKKMVKKHCCYMFLRGKNKGSPCNKKYSINIENEIEDNGFCKIHKKFQLKLEEKVYCKHILLRGKNKGKECGKKIISNSEYCKNHLK